ncbi:MAG: sugar ABC transporter permease [Sphaerochaetaceae bacterium]
MKERSIYAIAGYVATLPALLLVVILLLFPMLQNLYYSFTSWDALTNPVWVGLENYKELFSDPNFLLSFRNTIIWVIATLVFPVFGGLLIASFIRDLKGEEIFKSIIFFPLAISFVSTGIIWINMFASNSGVLNGLLSLLSGRVIKVQWLAEAPRNTYSMIVAWTWQQTGTNMVLFLMGLTSIPRDPVEAALIDGANKWQTFRFVTVPMLRPITTVVIAQALVNSFKTFDLIYVITRGGPYRSTETLAVTMYRESFTMFRLGYGAAISVVLSFIIILISGFYVRKQMGKEQLYY